MVSYIATLTLASGRSVWMPVLRVALKLTDGIIVHLTGKC